MPDLDWTFEQYHAYEERRAAESDAEQQQAISLGLIADPKSAPHGGYRVACTWYSEVTSQAGELSAQLAALVPGTPAYPQTSIHSSIGNLRPADGDRLIDPHHVPEDRQILDRLCQAAEEALQLANSGRQQFQTIFGPAYLAPRMAYIFGRVEAGYWRLQQAIHAACERTGVGLVNSWGPHLTLARFGAPANPGTARQVSKLLAGWRSISSPPTAIVVGYYTVGDGWFEVTPYHSFPTV